MSDIYNMVYNKGNKFPAIEMQNYYFVEVFITKITYQSKSIFKTRCKIFNILLFFKILV